jgi:hypothetical protein
MTTSRASIDLVADGRPSPSERRDRRRFFRRAETLARSLARSLVRAGNVTMRIMSSNGLPTATLCSVLVIDGAAVVEANARASERERESEIGATGSHLGAGESHGSPRRGGFRSVPFTGQAFPRTRFRCRRRARPATPLSPPPSSSSLSSLCDYLLVPRAARSPGTARGKNVTNAAHDTTDARTSCDTRCHGMHSFPVLSPSPSLSLGAAGAHSPAPYASATTTTTTARVVSLKHT